MILPTLDIENSLWHKGYKYVVGIDEVGRGSWAGPLVAAGVILPINFTIPEGLADSKLVKPQKRTILSKFILENALSSYIAEIPVKEIDKIGVGKATQEAFRQISRRIAPKAEFCLIDAFYIKYFSKKKQMAVKHGDQICASISAASIIAKVYRDNLMEKLHKTYPDYGFAKHKGYGTKVHQEAIKKYGFSKVHRRSYNLDYLFA
ncbi:MAG TPA: ribonuclease HII [Candidatus Saccharimonadales bacterium]|nr:ribonuclease HII [Candidatus Saccharimonadales bacterium]